jgi:hypothetical protein
MLGGMLALRRAVFVFMELFTLLAEYDPLAVFYTPSVRLALTRGAFACKINISKGFDRGTCPHFPRKESAPKAARCAA